MAILLVKQNDNAVPDSPGKWRQGEIVGAFPDDHVFGGAEVPAAGNFYHVTVTDRTVEQVLSYLQEWWHEPTSNIDSNDGNGNYVVTITSTMVSTSGANAITRAQMDGFVTKWGGTYQSHTNTSYTFGISSFDAATSEGFWGIDPVGAGVVFVDEGFASGTQQVGITNAGTFTPAQIAAAVERNGGTIIDANSFTIPAATVYTAFKDDIEESWRQISFRRRRWVINQAGLDYLAANGGTVSGTAAQISNYLTDQLTV